MPKSTDTLEVPTYLLPTAIQGELTQGAWRENIGDQGPCLEYVECDTDVLSLFMIEEVRTGVLGLFDMRGANSISAGRLLREVSEDDFYGSLRVPDLEDPERYQRIFSPPMDDIRLLRERIAEELDKA